ncbi:MAG: hypothetical protein ACXV8Q_12965 [Methylobacter sp.]
MGIIRLIIKAISGGSKRRTSKNKRTKKPDKLSELFNKKNPDIFKINGESKTTGELIAEITDGANLVDGKQTWEHVAERKHDLEYVKKCCVAELTTMDKANVVPAPYYFERVAILSRQEKNYAQEVLYCESYISAVESFYKKNGTKGIVDVRKGPRFQAIVKRLLKAKELLEKQSSN